MRYRSMGESVALGTYQDGASPILPSASLRDGKYYLVKPKYPVMGMRDYILNIPDSTNQYLLDGHVHGGLCYIPPRSNITGIPCKQGHALVDTAEKPTDELGGMLCLSIAAPLTGVTSLWSNAQLRTLKMSYYVNKFFQYLLPDVEFNGTTYHFSRADVPFYPKMTYRVPGWATEGQSGQKYYPKTWLQTLMEANVGCTTPRAGPSAPNNITFFTIFALPQYPTIPNNQALYRGRPVVMFRDDQWERGYTGPYGVYGNWFGSSTDLVVPVDWAPKTHVYWGGYGGNKTTLLFDTPMSYDFKNGHILYDEDGYKIFWEVAGFLGYYYWMYTDLLTPVPRGLVETCFDMEEVSVYG